MPTIMETRNPLLDGRQSDAALKIRRGTCRMLRIQGYTCLPELTLATGRRADLVCIGQKGEIIIVEIKSSVADFQMDQKWHEYKEFCDQFYFATSPEVPIEIFPADHGLIVSDEYNAEIIRVSEVQKIAPATRKALTLRFARFAANILQDLMDPAGARI